ncbi:hypothetical protein [Amycolatopsis circi]|uniref:hypothetical protein n=1 Tax=Amycolatopsis circi TaxID=871959 RepID=UPI000E25CD4B|nr:hypothetical protein [Amycolatopsis circi]
MFVAERAGTPGGDSKIEGGLTWRDLLCGCSAITVPSGRAVFVETALAVCPVTFSGIACSARSRALAVNPKGN